MCSAYVCNRVIYFILTICIVYEKLSIKRSELFILIEYTTIWSLNIISPIMCHQSYIGHCRSGYLQDISKWSVLYLIYHSNKYLFRISMSIYSWRTINCLIYLHITFVLTNDYYRNCVYQYLYIFSLFHLPTSHSLQDTYKRLTNKKSNQLHGEIMLS